MPIHSMTGFGGASAQSGDELVSVELRSVNGKFCDVKVRLPRELAELEIEVGKQVKARLSRGNVDVFVRREAASKTGALVPRVNGELMKSYAESLQEAAHKVGIDPKLSLSDLLELDGVVELEELPPDLEGAKQALAQALEQGLEALVSVRQREGAALETDFRERIAILRELSGRARELVPEQVAAYKERLESRLLELAAGVEIDPQRLAQEVVFFADRSDVSEELTRLDAHFDEFERLLGGEPPVGRRIEFLLQEINRETNTLGSKSHDTQIAQLVVEMKVEVERLREQSLNVE